MTFAHPREFALGAARDAEERLARDGYAAAFTYVSCDAAAQEVEQSPIARGRRAQAIRADSGKAEDIRSAVSIAVESLGKLDAVVVNAGIFKIATNDGGRVVTIGSNVAIRTGFPGASVCQMTKAAVAAMVKGIALAPMIY